MTQVNFINIHKDSADKIVYLLGLTIETITQLCVCVRHFGIMEHYTIPKTSVKQEPHADLENIVCVLTWLDFPLWFLANV
jgi:hypothetical protein